MADAEERGRAGLMPSRDAQWIIGVVVLAAGLILNQNCAMESRLNGRIDGLQLQIEGLQRQMDARIDGLQRQIDGLVDAVGEIRTDLRRLDDRLRAVEQRIIVVEQATPAAGVDEP